MHNDNILTDTHTHIYYSDHKKIEAQVNRCLERNIRRLFLPNVDVDSIPQVMDTVRTYPELCYPMLGLHPCSVKEDFEQQLQVIMSEIDKNTIYAIGEIGIDLYWDKSTLSIQQEAFRTQIGWAKQRNLPIVIHCREAFDQVFEILEEQKDDKLYGILHCFTGDQEQAQHAIDLGFKLGIGGVVTYKKSGLDNVVKEIDLKHIVLETDAPYLAPVPFRGKENESSYLYHVAEKIADLHQISVNELAEITTKNSKDIFKI